jgi:hypothetical protein
MKIKQLLCLGALMTLPMSMSADSRVIDALNNYAIQVEKLTDQPPVPACKNIVYVKDENFDVSVPDFSINSQLHLMLEDEGSNLHFMLRDEGIRDPSIKVATDYDHEHHLYSITSTFTGISCDQLNHDQIESVYDLYNSNYSSKIITPGTPSIFVDYYTQYTKIQIR